MNRRYGAAPGVAVVMCLSLLSACGREKVPPDLLQQQQGGAGSRDPVLFVHGWNGEGRTWDAMLENFRRAGWSDAQLFNWAYDSSQSNTLTAQQIAVMVERILRITGAEKVDIVTHSMGALSSRYYLKNLGGTAKVDAWVSLAGPNHGTYTSNLCGSAACGEMRLGSPFLAALNDGDETPGKVRYATWRSACDLVINPDSSVPLIGAVNVETACLTHENITRDGRVFSQVLAFITQ